MLRYLSLSLLMIACVVISARATDKIIILNGYFFNELPAAVNNQGFPKDLKIYSIETPEETRALGLYSPSLLLSEEVLKLAIPKENIKEGSELLRRYNDLIENSGSSKLSLESSTPLLKVGKKFPEFSATDISGKRWTNADIDGKIMVLNLWFTGCGPCRKEMPELSTWKDEMPDVMFFSSTYESPEVARQVLDKINFNWIPLVNDQQFKKFIGNNGYPLTIIVDKTGVIAAFEYGTSSRQRESLKNTLYELRQ